MPWAVRDSNRSVLSVGDFRDRTAIPCPLGVGDLADAAESPSGETMARKSSLDLVGVAHGDGPRHDRLHQFVEMVEPGLDG